nr:TonB-dependent receptor [Prolixibacteraceae bacterium]
EPAWLGNRMTPEIPAPCDPESFLDEFLSASDLHLIRFQDYWVVMPGRQTAAQNEQARQSHTFVIGNPLEKGKYTKAILSGVVTEGKTKTPVPGAQIFCETLSIATSSDSDGKYRLELPTGKHALKYSFMGLEEEIRDIVVYSNGELDVELYEKSISLGQINILAERPEDNFRSTAMGMVKLNIKAVKKLSVLMGEPDLIKSLVLLPGVQTSGENASGFNVRGGNTDQNLILIHDAPVFNTSHMFGLFSMLDPGIVDEVTLYKSGIPARYGGRISSVMDIELRKPKTEKIRVYGGIGIINSRLSVEGPLVNEKLTFSAGARSTYSDWILKLLNNYQLQQSKVQFYDLNAKMDYTPDNQNKISLFAYNSHDSFYYFENAEYGYGNQIASLKWNHLFNTLNSGTLNLNFSHYRSDVSDFSTKNYEYRLSTSIEEEQMAYHFSSNQFNRHKMNGGISVLRYMLRPGHTVPYSENSAAVETKMECEPALEAALYLEDEYDITPELSAIAGIRYSGFLLFGPASVKSYLSDAPLNQQTAFGEKLYTEGDIVGFHQGLEPRLALRYAFLKDGSVKVGYNRTLQYIRQISNSVSITPADFWKAADPFIRPLIADQFALGFYKNFGNQMFETSLEVYYKDIQNEVDYKNGARLILNNDLEQVLISGIGRAYGIELMVKKSSGKLTGWLAYTYSRSFRKMDGPFPEEKINNGEWYPSNYDKPHDLTVSLQYKLSRRFTLSSNFTYSTGRPITLPEYKYSIGNHEIIYFSERNKYRIDDYHRLDLALTYEGSLLKKQKWRSSWTLSLYNVYGRHNPFSVYYTKQRPHRLNDYKTYAMYQFSVIGVPIPSFTYNFWF